MDPNVLSYDFLRTKIDLRCSYILDGRLFARVNFHDDASLADSDMQSRALQAS